MYHNIKNKASWKLTLAHGRGACLCRCKVNSEDLKYQRGTAPATRQQHQPQEEPGPGVNCKSSVGFCSNMDSFYIAGNIWSGAPLWYFPYFQRMLGAILERD